jgi:hypothetical protein
MNEQYLDNKNFENDLNEELSDEAIDLAEVYGKYSIAC